MIHIYTKNKKSNQLYTFIKNEKGLELVQKIGLMAIGLFLVGAISVYVYNTGDPQFGQIENSTATIYDEIGTDTTANGGASIDVGRIKVFAFNTQRLGGYEAEHYALTENGLHIYTHTKSGTTHTLTGTGDNINFIATGTWNLGDTLKYNGSNAYFCDINGNKLDYNNLFTSGAAIRNIYAEFDSTNNIYKCYLIVFPK